MIERLDVRLHLAVRRIIQQHPVQSALVRPFGELCKLAAHEQHLLAWVCGDTVKLTIEGEDEETAAAAMQAFLESNL